MDDKKKELRGYYTTARKAIPAFTAERLSARIAANIYSLTQIADSDLVMLYHKIGSEVDTALLMGLLLDSGRGVALPYCRGDGSIGAGRIFSPQDDLKAGAYGIMEPAERLRDNISPSKINAVVCPGVAFDAAGGRLGRGGGHYDRFLKEVLGSAFIIGCAFDCQICGEPLPREEHDVAMDVVITEKRAFPEGACPAITQAAEGMIVWGGGYASHNESESGGGSAEFKDFDVKSTVA